MAGAGKQIGTEVPTSPFLLLVDTKKLITPTAFAAPANTALPHPKSMSSNPILLNQIQQKIQQLL